MRINKFVASATGLSRRSVDKTIIEGRVYINTKIANLGDQVTDKDKVYLDKQLLILTDQKTTIIVNKPIGYVCSRDGQGSKTIYELLPREFSKLKPVGRLDKDSSGLILLSDDGDLSFSLTHPKFSKTKVYKVNLDKELQSIHKYKLNHGEVTLDGKPSKMQIKNLGSSQDLEIILNEGRNRQIRRTFEKLGYRVEKLNRTAFGPYKLADLGSNLWLRVDN